MDTQTRMSYLRCQMVRDHLEARGIRHERIVDAFREVPRELFVPAELCEQAYEDHPISIGLGQTISQPYVVALMLQELRVTEGHRVLEIGAGSGYQTALLARLARHVYAIERLPELAERAMATLQHLCVGNVTLITGDGCVGWPEELPFDRIICGAAASGIPQAWIDQLADGGRILCPVGGGQCQTLVAIDRHGDALRRQEICQVRFVPLVVPGTQD